LKCFDPRLCRGLGQCSQQNHFGDPFAQEKSLLKPSPRKNLRTIRGLSSKFTKKIQFEENLCYLAFKKTIGPQKGGLLLDIIPGRQVAKPIFPSTDF
jgi:hypothetical protein